MFSTVVVGLVADNVASHSDALRVHPCFLIAKRVLDDGGKQHSNAPVFDASTARRHFHDIFREEDREFQQPHWLPEAPPPSHPFVDSPFTLEKLMLVINKSKVLSQPI